METVATVAAAIVAASSAVAGAWGAWRWWRVEPSRLFWWLLRTAQAAAIGFAVAAVALLLAGAEPEQGLFWLYAFLPAAVMAIAEQVRVLSAETVLAARDLPDAAAVGRLPEREQRSVVLAIARREMGVMALAALVVCFLALRAIGMTEGL